MSIIDLKIAIDALRVRDDGRPFRPQDLNLIEEAERLLGLKFPPTYRHFLNDVGFASIPPYTIYGIVNSDFINSGAPDAIWLTLDERERFGLPVSMVIVGDSGMGEWFCLDTSVVSEEGECPVVMWFNNEAPVTVVAEDFGAYLLALATDTFLY